MATMTMKAFLTAVVETEGIDTALADFAKAEIAKIDAKNAKRKTTQTAKQKATETVIMEIVANMSAADVLTAGSLATEKGVSTQQASAWLQKGVAMGLLTKFEVKVKGKGKVMGYKLPETENVDDSTDSDLASGETE